MSAFGEKNNRINRTEGGDYSVELFNKNTAETDEDNLEIKEARALAREAEDKAILAGRPESESRAFGQFVSVIGLQLSRATNKPIREVMNFDLTQEKYAEWMNRHENIERERTFEQRVLQSISSADTSIRQVAAALRKITWKSGTVNLDIGGGRFDEGTDYLSERNVENLVFDPFNRDEAHNRVVFERLRKGDIDSVTATNVLNVIREDAIRAEVIHQAARAVKSDGVAYFQVYEGDGTDIGKQTSKGWQNNAKANSYMKEVQEYFGDVSKTGNIIEARSPITGKTPAVWAFNGVEEYFQREIDDRQAAPNANTLLMNDMSSVITLFETANVSSPYHELMHHTLNVFDSLCDTDGVNEQFKQDFITILKEFSVTREQFRTDAGARRKVHEGFALGFEVYLDTGQAPSEELKAAFVHVRR
jgi:hypothetical protein